MSTRWVSLKAAVVAALMATSLLVVGVSPAASGGCPSSNASHATTWGYSSSWTSMNHYVGGSGTTRSGIYTEAVWTWSSHSNWVRFCWDVTNGSAEGISHWTPS